MTGRLLDKVALVTGAGSIGPGWGNGKATAVLFAREGARVLAADINLSAARETAQIIEAEGGVCQAVACDVSRADQVAAMIAACIERFGRIDILHNNVGIVELGGPVDTSEESWDRVNAIAPGPTLTGLTRASYTDPEARRATEALIPLGRLGQPDDLIGAVLFLASDESRWVTGSTVTVDGGYLAI